MRNLALFATSAVVFIAAFLVWSFRPPETTITLSGARAESSLTADGTLHVFVNFQNGAQADTLIGVSSAQAISAVIMTRTGDTTLPIPANSSPGMSSDGAFVVLEGVTGAIEEGRLIPISFEFETSGALSTRAIVSAPVDPHAAHMAMMTEGAMQANLVDPGQSLPALTVNIEPGANGAWMVQLEVEHFTFDEGATPPVHVPGHGHAHLYINGLKLQRMYGETAEIGQLPPGTYTVTVALNTNDHRPYSDASGPVMAEVEITVD